MDTTISSPPEEKKPRTPLERLLINRNYAYNWVGLIFSQIGNVIFGVATLLWVATTLARDAPWAAFALSGIVFLPTIVGLVTVTFAGVFVDRWDARRTQLFMDAARAVLFLLLVAATIVPLPFPAGSESANIFLLVCLYIVLMISSVCEPFVNASLNILLYDMVDEENLPRAFGRGQILNITSTIIGPPLAALIFFTIGIQWTILLNVLSFGISFYAFYMVRLPRKVKAAVLAADESQSGEAQQGQKSSFWREFLTGLRFTFGNRLIVAIVVAMILVTAGAAGIGVFDLYFTTNNLHTAPQIYAYLDVVIAVGAFLGALFVGPWLRPRIGMVKSYWVSVLFNGALFLLYSRLTNLVAAFVVLFVMGISQAVSSVAFGPILFKATPRPLLGRVNAAIAQMLTTVGLLSISLVPLLITIVLRDKFIHIIGLQFGPIDTLFSAVAILVITSALYLRVTLNDYIELLDKPLPRDENGEPLEPRPELLQPRPQQGWLSTLQKQVSICVVGVIVVVLLVARVASSTPTNAVSNVQLSHGHPANGQIVDGLSCTSTPGSAVIANVQLTVYVNGQLVGLPVGIGSVAPSQPGVTAFTSNGQTTCLYPLHVFEADNIIHVDLPTNRTYTLGEFFDIWGQPLSQAQVADYSADGQHALTFYVFDANGNMQRYAGDPRAIQLVEHETIVIVFNSPHAQPAPYNAWNGL